MSAEREFLIRQLRGAGARGAEVGELLEYNANPFDLSSLGGVLSLPLADEPFIDAWRSWRRQAARDGDATVLSRHLAELRFPIRRGVSEWPSYRQATRRGVDPDRLAEATGLPLAAPHSISFDVEESVAGAVPVIVVRDRRSFVNLVRALGRSNEPEPVPDALGGLMITGYRNWSRLRELHGTSPAALCAAGRAEAGQDRFMLLSTGPYSAVPASELGLEEQHWSRLSLDLRRSHEQVHYLTRRLLGSMRNNLFDELIADYLGMRLAWGLFRADWLLRFLGFEEGGGCRADARLGIYRGEPPLSEGAFAVLRDLVRRAITHLAAFDRELEARDAGELWHHPRLVAILGALASERLETLAAEDCVERLLAAAESLEARLLSNGGPGLRIPRHRAVRSAS